MTGWPGPEGVRAAGQGRRVTSEQGLTGVPVSCPRRVQTSRGAEGARRVAGAREASAGGGEGGSALGTMRTRPPCGDAQQGSGGRWDTGGQRAWPRGGGAWGVTRDSGGPPPLGRETWGRGGEARRVQKDGGAS